MAEKSQRRPAEKAEERRPKKKLDLKPSELEKEKFQDRKVLMELTSAAEKLDRAGKGDLETRVDRQRKLLIVTNVKTGKIVALQHKDKSFEAQLSSDQGKTWKMLSRHKTLKESENIMLHELKTK